MRVPDLKSRVGKVVGLELVNGHMVATKIESVTDDHFVVAGKMFVFHLVPSQQSPQGALVDLVPYGVPFFSPKEQTEIDPKHIMWVWDVGDDLEKAYIQKTSGLIKANANSLEQMEQNGKLLKFPKAA